MSNLSTAEPRLEDGHSTAHAAVAPARFCKLNTMLHANNESTAAFGKALHVGLHAGIVPVKETDDACHPTENMMLAVRLSA